MNGFINIQVRILAQQAMRQAQLVQAQLNGMGGAFTNAARAGQGFTRSLTASSAGLVRFGSQVQWTGRQLQYNFTLPILLAGGAAMKFALDNEAAMVRVTKVYGDGTQSAQVMSNELKALERNFEALSNAFGVNRAQVIGIAGDWAAAGASGVALAKATKLTLETMVLGEMEAKAATTALIAVQAQYGQSTEELAETIGILNMVENQTGISLSGLIDGFSRAAGVARSAGVDVRHLAAMLAALVPTTGGAAQAGNALKTIFSRLMSPTEEARDVLSLMGIEMTNLQWKSSNVGDQLIIMAKAFENLSDKQKGVVSAVVASRWQINKFEVLMRDLLQTNGFYAKALAATSDQQAVFTQTQRELNAVLSSNPRRLQMIWTMLQNAMADIIQPMIPFILSLAASISVLFRKFSELNPGVQKLIVVLLLFMALIGPLIRYMGATLVLVGSLGRAFALLGGPIVMVTNLLWTLVSVPLIAFLTRVGGAMLLFGRGLALIPGLIVSALAPLAVIASGVMTRLIAIVGVGMARLPVVIAATSRIMAGVWRAALFIMQFAFMAYWSAMNRMALAGAAAVQRTILMGAAMLGVVWRAGLVGMTLITSVTWIAIQRVFAVGVASLQGIIIAGARILGGVWRVALFLFTTGTAAAWAGIQRLTAAMMVGLRSIMVAGWAAIRTATLAAGAFVAAAWRGALFLMWALSMSWLARIRVLFTGFVAFLRTFSTAAMAALTGPWGAAAAIVIILLVAFWDEVKAIWKAMVQGTIQAFNALPKGIRGALMAVVNMVRSAVMAVYRLFSWMNPWAHHSPSLVENVTTGMDEIGRQFARAEGAADVFRQAGMDLEEFGRTVRRLQQIADDKSWAELRKNLASVAPEAIPSFDRLVAVLGPLKDILEGVNVELREQQAVVDALKPGLDAAKAAYDQQKSVLDALEKTADSYKDALEAATQRMRDFANAPIEGMKAMNDAIFQNTMDQKALQLQLMKMEDAVGPLDKLRDKLNGINGEMELLRGEQADLRQAGAGSDILSQYDEQIDVLKEQQKQIQDQVKPLQDLSDAIDELGRKGQMLDLENSLKFDPLKKQIDDVANSMKELPFDEIIAGVTANKAEVDRLTEAYDKAKAAVDAQKQVVDQLEAARDALQLSYDLENAKLDEIKNRYQEIEDRIRSIESAFRDLGQAAQDALGGSGAMSPGAQNFLDAAGGDFPDPGGMGGIGRENLDIADQSKMIDDLTKELADKSKNMFGLFDFMDPIKKGWNTAWAWLKANIAPVFSEVGSLIGSQISSMNPFEGVETWFGFVKGVFDTITGWLSGVWKVVGPDVIKIFTEAWLGLQDAFKQIQPEIEKFRDLIGPLGNLISNVWTIIKPILAVVLALIGLVLSALIGAIAGGIRPFLSAIGDMIAAIIRIFRGLIEFVVGVFTGDWEMAWTGIKDFFIGIWDLVFAVVAGTFKTILGLAEGLVKGIWDFFVWLKDELVGHSVIPDMVNAIVKWFTDMWKWAADIWNAMGRAIGEVFTWLKGLWDSYVTKFEWAKGKIFEYIAFLKTVFWGIVDAISGVWNTFRGYIDNIVDYVNGLARRFGFGGLFDGIKWAFQSAMNWVIGKWNNMSFGVGDIKISTPNIPFLARGGVTNGVAVVGEGRPQYPEYVIPTDPNYRKRAVELFSALGHQLGVGKSPDSALLASIVSGQQRGMFGQKVQMLAAGGIAGGKFKFRSIGGGGAVLYAPTTSHAEYHFHGNLEFPNISDGNDAEEFIKNLTALVGK